MLATISNRTVSLLENIVQTLDQYDDIAKREPVFAKMCQHQSQSKSSESDEKKSESDDANKKMNGNHKDRDQDE